jgi:uridine kinase
MNKVIAISGFPGSGKTSLMLELSKRIPGALLYYDNYQSITEHSIDEISAWMREGADYNDFIIPALAKDLGKLKMGENIIEPGTNRSINAQEYILFETPLGREHKDSGRFIDISVWIDLPLDVALARNLKMFNKIFLSHEEISLIKDDLDWLDMYLTNYLEQVRTMLIAQRKKLIKSADIILEGETTLELMTSNIMDALSLG